MKHPFKRLMHAYTYDLKLSGKLMVSHAILFLLPTAVVTGFFYASIYGIIINDSIRSEQALASQTMSSIERLMNSVVHAGDTVNGTGLVRDLLNHAHLLKNSRDLYSRRVDRLYRLTDSLTDGMVITDIRIYCDDGIYEAFASLNHPADPLFLSRSRDAGPWEQEFVGSSKTRMLFSPHELSPEESARFGDMAAVTKISSADLYLTDKDYRRESAYIAVYISSASLNASLNSASTMDGAVTYLVNGRDMMVASSDPALAAPYFLSHEDLETRAAGEFSLVSFPAGQAYSAYFPIADTDWYMVSILPSIHIADTGRSLFLHFILVYALFAALAIVIAVILSRSFARRIIGVAYEMEKSIRSGRPQPMKEHIESRDELGILSDTYNYMAAEMNRLMDRQKETSEALRRAEFKALQAQINPHFLYNTLDMINWLAQTGRKEEVTKAIQTLSRFYKLTLSRGRLINTISDELEHVSLYVQLQNMRFDNCVSFMVDVPEELFPYTIPKLTFQPLIENAFLHGIMMKEEKRGSILLTGWPEGKDMVFVISDDGVGMDEETLAHILEKKEPPEDASPASSSHIGVYNTDLRLKILYGKQYGLSYESAPGGGTEVTVRLPGKRGEE